jgi:hypothetical protein
MANILGNYNPTFFANEALIQLFKALGMAGRVHRGAEIERNTTGRALGDTINIRRPSHFVAKTHTPNTGSTAQDVTGQNVQITLDSWKEVKFGLNDQEIAYSSERIVSEHIAPAAYALADKIDQDLHALGAYVGPKAFISGTASSSWITGPRKVLRDNEVPMTQGMMHYLVDSGVEAAFLDMGIFHEARITGEGNNTAALMNGSLGERFGVEVFATQNADVSGPTMTSTATASTAGGDTAFSVTAEVLANVATMAVENGTGTETLKIGDTFVVTGDPTVYILTADATLIAGAATLTFYPALRKTAAISTVVTFATLNAIEESANLRNLMFHRNAFALAFAPLPMTGDGKGAEITTVTDPVTGLSVRARMWYDGDTAKNNIALDALYGVQVLDPMLATQVRRAATLAASS